MFSQISGTGADETRKQFGIKFNNVQKKHLMKVQLVVVQ